MLHLDVSGQQEPLLTTLQGPLSCTWTYLHYSSLCCTWKYLDYINLCCFWTCLHYRTWCIWTYQHLRGLSFTLDAPSLHGQEEQVLHLDVSTSQGLVPHMEVSILRGLCYTWMCLLPHRPKLHLDLSGHQDPVQCTAPAPASVVSTLQKPKMHLNVSINRHMTFLYKNICLV